MFSTSPGRERRTPETVAGPGAVHTNIGCRAHVAGTVHVLAGGPAAIGLTARNRLSRLERLPRDQAERLLSVRARSLRTQQRAKSQCQTTPSGAVGLEPIRVSDPLSRRKFLWYRQDN